MAYYAEPNSTDTVGFYEFFRYVNTTAEGLFFPVILLVVWVVIFVGTKQYSTARAWTVASAITAFLSIPLAITSLIASRYMYLSFVLTAVGVLWLKLEK